MKLNEKKLHAFLLVHKMKMMITLVLHIHFASKYRYIYIANEKRIVESKQKNTKENENGK